MKRLLGWVIFAVLGGAAVIFSVNNLKPTEIDPWPFADPVDVATYLIVLLALLAGFLVGAAVAWLTAFPARRRAARDRREGAKLRAELATLKTDGPVRPVGTALAPTEPANRDRPSAAQ